MQPIGRLPYLFSGLLLMLLKFAVDAATANWFGQRWSVLMYWSPMNLRIFSIADSETTYALTLAAISVPFTAIGIWLTARRLRTLQLGIWLTFLFFLPVVNLIFFLFLVMAPEFDGDSVTGHAESNAPGVLRRDSLTALFASSSLAAACACLAVGLSITTVQSYGWGVFFAVPFGVGLLTTLLVSISKPRSFRYCVGASLFSLSLAAAFLLAIAFEGIVCLVMCIPLAIPLAMLGVFVGREIVRPGPRQIPTQAAILALLVVTICPLSAAGEKMSAPREDLVAVVTSVEIQATPDKVWPNVIAFPELPPPSELLFHAGIAYPVRARIDGQGPGAIRYCEFSTGPFVEPITTWQAPHLLAFSVSSSPAPMRELSPYDIHPPHLDGFLKSRRGQFRLIPLGDGRRTLLEGTTWYQQSLYPASYWQQWTNWIIHRIHLRVLHHIRDISES